MTGAVVLLVLALVLEGARRSWERRALRRAVGAVRSERRDPGGRTQSRALVAELPLAIDLVQFALESGRTLGGAITVAARWGPASWRDPFGAIVRRVELGSSLAEAVDAAASERPELDHWRDLLLAAARSGAAVAPLFALLAENARAEARHAAEARARRLPVLLLLPLVGCFLPAFVCLAVAPTVVAALDRVGN